MSLLDEARVAQKSHGPVCRVKVVLSMTSGALLDEVNDLLEAVLTREVYATTAVSILKEHNLVLTQESLRNHIARKCQCL